MNKILFLLILLFNLSVVNAQKVYHDLSSLQPLDRWEWNFTIDSIIDVRHEPEVLGYIFKGNFDDRMLAVEKHPLTEDLNRLLRVGQSIEFTNGYHLRINRLFSYEVLEGGLPMAVTEINISFIKKDKTGYIEVFQAMTTISEKGKDATSWLGYTIEKAFRKCFDDFQNRTISGRNKPFRISEEALNLNPYGSRLFAIHKTKTPKKALFFDLYDMRDNIGDTVTTFYPDIRYNRKNEIKSATIDLLDKRQMAKSVFGFTDGKTVFIKAGRKFVPLKLIDGEMVIDSYEEDHSAEIAQLVMWGIVAGVVGGPAAVTATLLANQIEKTDYWVVDFDRGYVVPDRHKDVKEVSGQTIIFASRYNKDRDTVAVTINGKAVCKLLPNQYYIHYSDYKAEPINLCIKVGETTTCEEIKPELFIRTIWLARAKRNEKLELGTVWGNTRGEIYKNIKEGRAVRAEASDLN